MHVGIVSGYFNPIHKGHLEYINSAKKLCDHLIAIVNNDIQVELKGTKKFLDVIHRKIIIENIKSIDEVFVSIDNDLGVSESLKNIRQKYKNNKCTFYNSGDRNFENWNNKEVQVSSMYDINLVCLNQPKISSSSDILKYGIS